MSEFIPTPEISQEKIELNSALIAYFVSAAISASSQGFEDDTLTGISYINGNKSHWHNGEPITEENKRAFAASSILVQLCKAFETDNEECDLVVLNPLVSSQLEMYLSVQRDIDDLGLSFNKDVINIALVRRTVRAMGGPDPGPNLYAVRAAEQWAKRGWLELEMIHLEDLTKEEYQTDYSTTAPDRYYEVPMMGDSVIGVSEYPLPETPVTTERVPYYKKFYDEKQGEEWLASILEDLKAIKYGV